MVNDLEFIQCFSSVSTGLTTLATFTHIHTPMAVFSKTNNCLQSIKHFIITHGKPTGVGLNVIANGLY